MGAQCSLIKPGYFFPNFTYIKYEPEFSNANGTFSWYYLVRNYAKYFTGMVFYFLFFVLNITLAKKQSVGVYF